MPFPTVAVSAEISPAQLPVLQHAATQSGPQGWPGKQQLSPECLSLDGQGSAEHLRNTNADLS